jgi:tellurite methyltransferase
MTHSIRFFDTQFSRQVEAGEFKLNPFELAVLPYLSGRVLDYGCGLGNLALEAARRGCTVLAYDAAPAAVAHLNAAAQGEGLAVEARLADLREHRPEGEFDAVATIGLLMFFDPATARAQLADLQAVVRPGGIFAVNALVEGTSFLGMFGDDPYYLFDPGELRAACAGWEILLERAESFPAPGDTVKAFVTLVARKP